MHASTQQQRGAGVPQIVKTYIRQSGALQQRLKRTVREVAGIKGGSTRRGEYEPIVLPQPGKPSGLLELAVVVASENVRGPSGQFDAAATFGALGSGELWPLLRRG